MMKIYMDNAATTRVTEPVFEAMKPYFCESFGNASSIHGYGREAKKALENARRQTAQALDCLPEEVFFTSCGSESDNWALKSTLRPGDHLITTKIEHHAILHTAEALEKQGVSVTFLPVDGCGRVSSDSVRNAIRPETKLISVMAVNNEIGTIEPVREISELARSEGILFHTDAVQAVGNIPVSAHDFDMLSLSGHKFHAPKGIGVLYVKKGLALPPFIDGGAQERRRRAGTENIAFIAGLGRAIEIACGSIAEKQAYVSSLTNRLLTGLTSAIPGVTLNGPEEGRIAGTLNLSFKDVGGEALLLNLDLKGIAVSAGSACTAGSPEPSHVLSALGKGDEIVKSAVRFSLCEENTPEEVETVIAETASIVEKIRAMR